MTQDKDREAFEKIELKGYTDLTRRENGNYYHDSVRNRWIGFQASLAYERANAPKLTEAEVLKIISDITWRARNSVAEDIIAALKAAGMSFKEDGE